MIITPVEVSLAILILFWVVLFFASLGEETTPGEAFFFSGTLACLLTPSISIILIFLRGPV